LRLHGQPLLHGLLLPPLLLLLLPLLLTSVRYRCLTKVLTP